MKYALVCACLLAALLSCGCARNKHIVVRSVWEGDFCCSVYEDGTAEIIAYRGQEESLTIPEKIGKYKVVGFGPKAFDGAVGLRQAAVPDTVTKLPAKLFNGCPDLEAVYIPVSVKTIGKNLVYNCPNFTKVMYAGTEAEWKAVNVGSAPWTDNYVLINAEIQYGVRP